MPTFRLVSFLSRLLRNLPQRGHVLRSVVLADPAMVFPESHVQAPVQGVLDAPVSAHHLQQSLRRGIQAADVGTGVCTVGPCRRLPAAHHLDHRAQAGPVLPGAQVLQARWVADCLALPTFYPSVVFVQGGGVVMGHSPEAELPRSLEQVPHVFIQLTLVLLQCQHVAGSPVQNPLGDLLLAAHGVEPERGDDAPASGPALAATGGSR